MSDTTPRDDVSTDVISADQPAHTIATDHSAEYAQGTDQIRDGNTYVTDDDLTTRVADIPPDHQLADLINTNPPTPEP